MIGRNKVFDLIDAERSCQDILHGTIEDHPHPLAGWLLILEAELNEAKEAWISGEDVLGEIVDVAAVAVACLEQFVINEKEE